MRKEGDRWHKLLDLFSACSIGSKRHVDPRKEQVVDAFVSKKHYDWIVTRYMSEALTMGLMKYADRLVVDIDDSPVDKAMDFVKLAGTPRNKVYLWLQALATRAAFRRFIDKVAITALSDYRQALRYRTRFLPNLPFNTVTAPEVSLDKAQNGHILFVGNLSYYANHLGMDHFMTHVYPFLKKRKGLEMHICGQGLDDDLEKKWNAMEGVRIMGYVPDIVREYADAEIVVIPIYHGAGTCIKVLEAMQMHRLVITTPKGIRGYDDFFTPGVDYLLAKDDRSFVSMIEEALGNVPLQTRLTEHAAKVVEKNYSKDFLFDRVKDMLSSDR
ncbi:MAG: glycosyltransferase [Bacteroidales bacterium]|nr:glycosyltransferase [Bacteroidales bacterium]